MGPALALREIAGVHQEEHDLLQDLEVPRRVGSEQLLQLLEVHRLQVPGEERLLEPLQALHGAHELDRLRVRERARPMEEVAVAALEILEVAEVVQLLEEPLERLAALRRGRADLT